MSTSFAQIAATMDPLEPPKSLRVLAGRHRWPGGLPSIVSLQVLGLRHNHPDTTKHRLLWLNSWLIQAFQLSLCNAIHIGRILPVLKSYLQEWWINNLPAKDLIEPFNITAEKLAEAFPEEEFPQLSREMLVETFSDIAHSFVENVSSWVPGLGWVIKQVAKGVDEVTKGDMLGKLSPYQLIDNFEFMTTDEIITRIGLDAGQIGVAFCNQFAGWLEDRTGWPINDTWVTFGEAAPNRPERAYAIGQMLGKDYDIGGLCEVFEPDRQSDVLKGASESGRITSGHPGPGPDGEIAGSGLLTVTFDGRSTGSSSSSSGLFGLPNLPGVSIFGGDSKMVRVFSNQGDRVRDADAWSRKGVLLTVVNVGVGKIDLYTTHLYEGGSLLDEPTDEQRWTVKLSQINDIVDFIADTHNNDHVAVLMGDFNVAADEPEYKTMMERLTTRDLVDLWPFWSQLPAPGPVFIPPGATNNTDLCKHINSNLPFCAEPGPSGGRRIDFIFVEQPREQHKFTIDFSRIRRRGDLFQGSKLSDHLGLDVMLIVAPRAHLPA